MNKQIINFYNKVDIDQISKAAQNGKQNRGNRFGKRRSSGYWHFFCISVPFNGSRLCFGKIIAII